MNTTKRNEGSEYDWHPIACIFPMMHDPDIEEMTESFTRSGFRPEAAVVLYEGMILDGRNRERAALLANVKPLYRNFDPDTDGPDPTRFVLDHNLARRHLTPGQRAACATEALVFLEAEAKKRSAANLKQYQAAPAADPADPAVTLAADVTGTAGAADEGAIADAPGESAAKVAEKFGTSARSVKRAKRVKTADPDKFEDLKEGKTSLNAAEKEAKEKERAEDLDDPAFQERRLEAAPALKKQHGDDFAAAVLTGTILKTKAEFDYFIEANAEEQAILIPYIVTGWDPKRAMKFIMRALEAKDPIEHLITRAANSGKGKYETVVNGWKITLKLEK